MSTLSKKLRDCEGDILHFWCPGCNQAHGVRICEGGWTWNQNAERPTFSPSVLVRGYELSAEGYAMIARGESPPAGTRYPGLKVVCHSFVADGRIQFLGDCTHALRGQTVDLPDWTEAGT